MSKKENNHQAVVEDSNAVDDISIIRNILLGQQMMEYQEKFDLLNNRLDLMEESFQNKLQQMTKANKERSSHLEKEMGLNFKQLEKLILDSTKTLDKKLEKVSNEDKKRLGKMMGDLSKKLIGE